MSNLFSGFDSPGPFANLELPSEAPVSPFAQFRQAQVAAMANLNPDSQDLMAEFQALQTQYEQNIQAFGENGVRAEAAYKQAQRDAAGLQALSQEDFRTDPTGKLQAGAAQAAREAIEGDIGRREKAALEKAAIDRVMDVAGSDPEQANMLLNLMEMGGPVDQVRDMNTKMLILQRELDRAQSEHKDQPWYRHVVDFALENILLNTSMGFTGNVPTSEYKNVLANAFSQVQAGNRRRSEAASLWNIPAEDFGDFVREHLLPNIDSNSTLLGYTSNTERLNILSGLMDTPRPLETNTWNLIDNFGLVLLGGKAAKAAVSVPATLLRMGGRKQAAAAMAAAASAVIREGTEAAAQRAGASSIDEVAQGLTPTMNQVTPAPYVVSPQAMANNLLDQADEIMSQLPTWLQPGRFVDSAEYDKAVEQFIKQQTERFNSPVVDAAPAAVRTNDGSAVTAVRFTLGRNGADGWVREGDAWRNARGLGFGDAQVVKGEDGKFFIQIERIMPETGVYTNPLNVQTDNIIKRFLSGARERSDINLANMAQRSEGARNRIINDTVRQLYKDIRVDPASRERLANLWQVGENNGRWWSLDEANALYQRTYNRDISQREWKAYQGLRRINDIEYLIRNDLVWKEKALRGLETGTIELGYRAPLTANVLVDEGFNKGLKGRGYNVTTGVEYDEAFTAKDIELFKADGFVNIHLDEAIETPSGSQVHTLVVRRDSLIRERLHRQQLSYRAGGHRIYEDQYFAKQTVRKAHGDGSEFYDNPSTFMVGTRAQVQAWTDVMEKLRVAVRDNPQITAADLDAIVGGRPGFPTGQQFLDGVAAGTYRTDFKFGTYFDREMPEEYIRGNNPFVDFDEDGITSYLRTHGRLYYSSKNTTGLVDWQGSQAPTLDAWQATNKAFLNIANMASFSDYKLSSIERWTQTFGKYIEANPAHRTNVERFMNGKPNQLAVQDGVVQAMIDQQNIIKRNLGWRTELDQQIAQQQRKLSEWIMGTDPESLRHSVSRRAINWATEANPLQFMRGLAFDLKLGLFSPVQLFLQTGTTLAMAAIDPGGAMKGLRSFLPLRGMIAWKGSDKELVDTMIKSNLHKAAGFDDVDEFTAFMGAAKTSGFFSLNDSHSLVNAMGPNSSMNLTKNTFDNIRQHGRFFFNEGEMWNRVIAFRSAWEHTKKAVGDINSVTPEDFLNRVLGRAEDLSMSMSRTSQASWQQGLASLPTQFWAYQARMMEAMLGGLTGKGRFTRKESWSLILSQLFLYGAAGVPLAPVIGDLVKQKNGESPELWTAGGFIDRGAMDHMWSAVTGGGDALLSDRLGTGGWLGDTIGSLMGLSQYGEQSTADILGGATWSISADLWNDIGPILKYSLHEAGGESVVPLTERAVANLAKNVTSLSTAFKVDAILKYGHFIDNSGKVVVDQVPTSQAFATLLLGAQPGQADDLSSMIRHSRDRTKEVEEASRVIEQYRQELFNHPEKVDEISAEINLFVNLLDDDVRTRALRQAHRNTGPSMYSSFVERRERERQQQAMKEAVSGESN